MGGIVYSGGTGQEWRRGGDPVDMGCGFRIPLRESRFAGLSSYQFERDGPSGFLDKRNRALAINATVDGSWKFKSGRSSATIVPGTVIAMENNDEYACAHTHLMPNSSLIVYLFDTALDSDAGEIFGRRVLEMSMVASLIRRARHAVDDEHFHSRVFEIFDFVSQASRPASGPRQRQMLRVQRMKRFIEYNLSERILLADIARAAGLSPFHCLRTFKRGTGLTPNAYLMKCRILEASRLLQKPKIEVVTIARQCGFVDQAYFSHAFKNCTGLSPSEFRRQALR